MTHKFKAVLTRPAGTGTWTYLDIPFNAAEAFGCRGQIKVKGTIDGEPFRSTLMSGGDGGHYLVVKQAIREKIGKAHGDTVKVELEADEEPREVIIPDDFQAALSLNEAASASFEKMAYSHKKQYVDHINEAKAVDTRMKRIDKAVAMIAEDKKVK